MSTSGVIDLHKFGAYLGARGKPPAHVARVKSRVCALINGKGIKHKSRKNQPFCKGRCITLNDDLQLLRDEAEAWMPYKHSDPRSKHFDRSHGWVINHPLVLLQAYKESLATEAS